MTAGIAALALVQSFGEDVVAGHAAMPVAVAHVGVAQHVDAARPIDRARLDQRVLGLAAIGAAVHAQRAADAAGNAAHERQSGDAGLLRRARDFDVGHRRTGANARVFDGDIAKTAAEPDHHARHATVAHDEIGAEPDDGHRNVRRQIGQRIAKVLLIFRHEQNLRRAADAKPGQLRQRLVRQQPAAQRRHFGFQLGDDVGKAHAAAPTTLSSQAASTLAPSSRVVGPNVCTWRRISRGSMPALPSSTV